jgi:hypothetical protein
LAPPVAREEFFDGPIDAQDAFLEDWSGFTIKGGR